MTTEELLAKIKNQIDEGCTNCYGEPQAFVDLKNGRRIEVVHEEDGLSEREQYYIVTLRCADKEYDSFKEDNGIVAFWSCKDGCTLDDIAPILSDALTANAEEVIRCVEFAGCLNENAQVSLGDGYIDMVLNPNETMLEQLVCLTDLLAVTGDSTFKAFRENYDVTVTASMNVNDINNDLTVVVAIANDNEGVYDIPYELANDEYASLYDEIEAHAKRHGYSIDQYIEMAKTEGECRVIDDPIKSKRGDAELEH